MRQPDPFAEVEAAAFAILAADANALSNAKSFGARLGDRAPTAKKESRILAQAIADGAGPIKAASGDRQIVRTQLASRLENEHGYRADLAQWAVNLVDRLIHGGDISAGRPFAANPAPQPAHPASADAFVNLTPHSSPVAAPTTEGTKGSQYVRMGIAGWILTLIAIIGWALAFVVSIGSIYVFSTYSYAGDFGGQSEEAVWMLGYAATIGLPIGAIAASRSPLSVIVAFLLTFLHLTVLAGASGAIGRLMVLLPCALLSVASAFVLKRTDSSFVGLGVTALAAAIAAGLHMAAASGLYVAGEQASISAIKLAAGLSSAAITAGLGAYVAGLLFRNFGSPKI